LIKFAAALALVLASWVAEADAVPVSPAVILVAEVTEAVPVAKKAHQPTSKAKDIKKAVAKTPRKRSPKTATATAW
jgi:Skp family chaperone for outer membrane proteins